MDEAVARMPLRSIAALVGGLIAGSVVIMAIELANAALYRPPDPGAEREAFERFVANAPPLMFVLLLLAYSAGSFVGAHVAARLAARGRIIHGMIIGAFFLLGGIANLFAFPHPLWVAVLTVLIFLPMAYAGARLAG